MKAHYATKEEAREHVEAFLRAWEIDCALQAHGFPQIHFEFEKAEVIDRDPPPPGTPQAIRAVGIATGFAVGIAAVSHCGRSSYPPPPERFKLTPDVEVMWQRYLGYRAGKEPLGSLAYFCLTVFEGRQTRKGKRDRVSCQLNIEKNILDKLGELSTERGGETARKHGGLRKPYTQAEEIWIEAAIRLLIKRLGEYEADPDAALIKISVGDLPKCP
jgi:hypothetical protein